MMSLRVRCTLLPKYRILSTTKNRFDRDKINNEKLLKFYFLSHRSFFFSKTFYFKRRTTRDYKFNS